MRATYRRGRTSARDVCLRVCPLYSHCTHTLCARSLCVPIYFIFYAQTQSHTRQRRTARTQAARANGRTDEHKYAHMHSASTPRYVYKEHYTICDAAAAAAATSALVVLMVWAVGCDCTRSETKCARAERSGRAWLHRHARARDTFASLAFGARHGCDDAVAELKHFAK